MAARTHPAPARYTGTTSYPGTSRSDIQGFNKRIATSPSIQGYLDSLTETMALRARNKLEQHRLEGHTRIVTEKHRNGIDRNVVLEDTSEEPDALAIEFGHWTASPEEYRAAGWGRNHFVEGLNILGSLVGAEPRRSGKRKKRK